jgi:hypothetical protein
MQPREGRDVAVGLLVDQFLKPFPAVRIDIHFLIRHEN